MSLLSVDSLFIYPVKSCSGIPLQNIRIDNYGVENDRKWMVVDEKGEMITQRESPELALVKTEINDEYLRISYKHSFVKLFLLQVNSHNYYTSVFGSEPLSVTDEGDEASSFFSDILHRKCRLVRRSELYKRDVTSGKITGKHQVGFVDSHPILILSQSSLTALNQRLTEPLPYNRFRPNIVIGGDCNEFDEDNWRVIEVDTLLFDFGKRCSRCMITTINQQTLEKGKEPLHELANFRRDERGKVCFGAYFTNRQTNGTLSVGSRVIIHQSEKNPLNASNN